MRSLRWLLLGAGLAVATPAQAQVLITEVQPNPNGSDDAEWIEIHNTGSAAVSIAGWTLNDFGPATPRQYAFPTGTTLNAGQVIIVTRQANAYIAMAASDMLPVTTPDYELAAGADDVTVPNLTILVNGSGGLALGNSGDGVQLANAMGTVQSTAEWGNGRTEVPGNPATAPASGQTIGRIANTGSADVDFVVLTTPTPGTGFAGNMPMPPSISGLDRSPATLTSAAITVQANIVDVDGVAGAQLFVAPAGSAVTGPASGAYTGTSMTNLMATYSAQASLPSVPPTAFNQQYLRYYVEATDTTMQSGTSPAGATAAAGNTAFYWENVLPPGVTTPIATARQQNMQELPVWDGHSVRIQGVALTTGESFINGLTNFFVATPGMGVVEAIRVFDDLPPAGTINPGDVVTVVGKIGAFRGVRQIGQDERGDQPGVTGAEVTVTVSGTAPVPMHTVNISTLLASGEQYESSLVEIPNVSFSGGAPMTWAANTNVDVTDGTGTLTIRVISTTSLAGAATPTGPFTVRGILTQFAPGGTGGYQLQPRSGADVLTGQPPVDGGVMTDSGVDAGNPPDGGVMPPMDGGVMPPVDGGSPPPMDAGPPPPMDGGPPPPMDGGPPPPMDAGPRPDAAMPPADAGQAQDSGLPLPDAGTGGPADTGVGSRPDSGTFGGGGGGGTRDRDSGGCVCVEDATDGPGMGLGLLGLFALVLVRRRR